MSKKHRRLLRRINLARIVNRAGRMIATFAALQRDAMDIVRFRFAPSRKPITYGDMTGGAGKSYTIGEIRINGMRTGK